MPKNIGKKLRKALSVAFAAVFAFGSAGTALSTVHAENKTPPVGVTFYSFDRGTEVPMGGVEYEVYTYNHWGNKIDVPRDGDGRLITNPRYKTLYFKYVSGINEAGQIIPKELREGKLQRSIYDADADGYLHIWVYDRADFSKSFKVVTANPWMDTDKFGNLVLTIGGKDYTEDQIKKEKFFLSDLQNAKIKNLDALTKEADREFDTSKAYITFEPEELAKLLGKKNDPSSRNKYMIMNLEIHVPEREEVKPTAEPTATPATTPTASPTAAPTTKPTAAPTAEPEDKTYTYTVSLDNGKTYQPEDVKGEIEAYFQYPGEKEEAEWANKGTDKKPAIELSAKQAKAIKNGTAILTDLQVPGSFYDELEKLGYANHDGFRKLKDGSARTYHPAYLENLKISIKGNNIDFKFSKLKNPEKTPSPKPEKKTVTLKFDTNGGEKVKSITSEDKVLWTPALGGYPEKDGYSFAGWFYDKDFKNAVDMDMNNIEIDKDTTVYAKFLKNPEAIKATLKAEEKNVKAGDTVKFDLEFKTPDVKKFEIKNSQFDGQLLVSFDNIPGLSTKDIVPTDTNPEKIDWNSIDKQTPLVEAMWNKADIYVDGKKLSKDERTAMFPIAATSTDAEDKHAGFRLNLTDWDWENQTWKDNGGKNVKIVMPYTVTKDMLDKDGKFTVTAWIDSLYVPSTKGSSHASDEVNVDVKSDGTPAKAATAAVAAASLAKRQYLVTSDGTSRWHNNWKGRDTIGPEKPTVTPPTVTIQKLDNDGNQVKGAQLALFDGDHAIKTWKSDDGDQTFSAGTLINGKTYTIRETKVPDGYQKADDITFVYNINNGDAIYKMIDAKIVLQPVTPEKPTVTINKVDDNGKAVKGAELTLYKGDVATGKTLYQVDRWTTDGTPHVVKGLENNAFYSIKETKAPDRYLKSGDVIFETDGTSKDLTINVVDTKKQNVTISKVDSNGKRIAGAKLRLIDATKKEVATWTTDGKSDKTFDTLTDGAKYTVQEVSAPAGYVKAKDVSFTYRAEAKNQIVKMVDAKTPVVKKKEEGYTGLPVNPAPIIGLDMIAAGVVLLVVEKRKKA